MTGIPFFVALILVGVFFLMKMYFLRRQLWYEQFASNGWDRVVGYLATAMVFTMLTAYGLYGINLMLNAPPAFSLSSTTGSASAPEVEPPPGREEQLPASPPIPPVEEKTPSRTEENTPGEPETPVLADNPATDYREDRPLWWNARLGKKRPTESAAPNERSQTADTGTHPLVIQPSRLLSVKTAVDPASASLPKSTDSSSITFERFVRDTLSQSNHALGCWLLAAILEGFIVLLIVLNRA
ncbi:MAG: hypothetical protein SF339_15135 [Blastocatellia bacterium]|nr:hypothetical protein [Blastocatellia bacterium]